MWDGFGHVDPVKEANAQSIRLSNHTTTLAEECAREGKDYEMVLHQLAREFKLAKKLGLPVSIQPGTVVMNDESDE